MRSLLIWLMTALSVQAEDVAGTFDYFVLSLSWSPNWCRLEGDARGSPQCEPARGHGWILHGLWPQYESGYPEYCRTTEPGPSRNMTAQMAGIMGTSGLAWHQWKKHGTCSGLDAPAYFNMSRDAFDTVTRPEVFRQLTGAVRMPASVVEEAFLAENPDLTADMITITCRQGFVQEARICLTKGLEPRICGADVRRDCALDRAVFEPVR